MNPKREFTTPRNVINALTATNAPKARTASESLNIQNFSTNTAGSRWITSQAKKPLYTGRRGFWRAQGGLWLQTIFDPRKEECQNRNAFSLLCVQLQKVLQQNHSKKNENISFREKETQRKIDRLIFPQFNIKKQRVAIPSALHCSDFQKKDSFLS